MAVRTLRRKLDRLAARAGAAGECPDCRPERLMVFAPDERSIPAPRVRCDCGRNLRGRVQVVVGVTEADVVGAGQ